MEIISDLISEKLIQRRTLFDQFISSGINLKKIEKFIELVTNTILNKNILFFAGNGGSAAEAQHMAAEYVCRFKLNRRSYGAISLTTDSSNLTAIANDFSFDEVFSRQIESLGKKNDLYFLYSTSGLSKNIIKAAHMIKDKKGVSIAMTGNDGGTLAKICDHSLIIKSSETSQIQEMHNVVGHIICEQVEKNLS